MIRNEKLLQDYQVWQNCVYNIKLRIPNLIKMAEKAESDSHNGKLQHSLELLSEDMVEDFNFACTLAQDILINLPSHDDTALYIKRTLENLKTQLSKLCGIFPQDLKGLGCN